MDQELKDRLNKIEKMVSDNNRMLSKMRKAQKKAAFFRVLWWLVIIAVTIESYRLIKPYLQQAENTYNSVDSSINSLKAL